MLHIRSADTERQRGESAVRTRVRVARYNCHAGQRSALLGADDVDDPLVPTLDAGLPNAEHCDAELAAVYVKLAHLHARQRVGDADTLGRRRRHVVIDRGDHRFGTPGLTTGEAQTFKGLWARDLVDEMAINIQQRLAIRRLLDEVALPELFEQRLRESSRGHRVRFGVLQG